MARMLITDDAAFMRMMLKQILSQGGHEVVAEATNGQEAIEQYSKHLPEFVTMDITMPVMDAINAGAKGFLVKPFEQIKVFEEMSRML